MKAYTTEEINSLVNNQNFNANVIFSHEQFKLWMIENGHREQEKPFKTVYKSVGFVIYWVDKNTWFGFDSSGRWIDSKTLRLGFDDSWQPFPQEKWDEMLLNYAKSRGHKNGNYRCLEIPSSTITLSGKPIFIVEDGDVWVTGSDGCGNKIFNGKTGVWAEIIEVKEEIKDHFLDAFKYSLGIDFGSVKEQEPKYTKAEWIEKMKQVKP